MDWETCTYCNGTGSVSSRDNEGKWVSKQCPSCRGTKKQVKPPPKVD